MPTGRCASCSASTAFRPGQREAVVAARDGRDVLVVMPTGSGKSLCYQLPALMRTDLTLVVSPLVSLMQDQVEALRARRARAASRWSTRSRTRATNRLAVERAVAGRVRLLYVAPERFASPGFLERIREARIGLFVVDEAHCVSQWGHDFRPEYFRLADAARWLGAEAIVASTATATPAVARDIVARLGLRDPVHVATGFDRPNLSFCVVPCANKEVVHRRIAAALAEPERAAGDRLRGHARGVRPAVGAARARARRSRCVAYHAGLPRDVRAEAQRRFMAGAAPVVVATNAFGMGVDKADVRTVCHESVPSSIEAYYQEAGRAGRDGRPARCLLFATGARQGPARVLHRALGGRGGPAEGASRARSCAPRRATRRASTCTSTSSRGARARRRRVRAIVGYMARAGVIQPAPSAPDRVAGRRDRRVGPRLAGASAAPPPRRARASAGASTAPSGRGSRAAAAGARASCATSAIARRPRRPARAATSATRRSCRPRRRPRRASARSRRRGTWTARSCEVVAAASAGRRPHALRRGPARRPLEGDREALLRRPAALRRVPRPARRGGPRRGRRAARRRAACARPAAASRSSDGRVTHGRRPRVRRRLEPPSDPRSRPRARGATSSPSARTSLARRRSPAPRPPACPRRRSRAPTTRPARRATSRWPSWLARARRRAGRARRLHAARHARVPGRVPAARDQRAPGAAARVPRPAGDRAGARLRRQGVRRHRPLRRRGRRTPGR